MLQPFELKELQAICELMGVPHSGTKAQCLDRIFTAAALRTLLAHYTDDPQPLADAMKLREMQQHLISVGAYRGTTKYQAAAGLLNWRNSCRQRGQRVLAKARALAKAPVQRRLDFE